MSFHFLKQNRLKNKSDFDHLRVKSRFFVSGNLLFFYKKNLNDGPETRIGISVSKKYGNAVKRNKAKRLIREGFRTSKFLESGKDVLVVVNSKKIKSKKLSHKEVELNIFSDLHGGLSHICS